MSDVRWHVIIRNRGGGLPHRVELQRDDDGGRQRRTVSSHERPIDAARAAAAVRADPEAHWRPPGKRGRKPLTVSWAVYLTRVAQGRVTVTIQRRAKGERQRATVVARCESRAEAEAYRERVRLDPAAHWREPSPRHPQAAASERRAAKRAAALPERPPPERVRAIRPGPPPEPLPDGRWALACGLHEAATPLRECPACARAHAETLAALGDATPKWRAA
jgi:hypothetical protein